MANSQVGIQDSGSNYNYFEEPRKPRLPKSLFDLSYINTGTADVGLLIPIYLQETVPGDEFTINCEALLRCVNPPVVPLLSRLRVFFHFYWSSCESLWKGFPMFITKGRSGNYSLTVPKVAFSDGANAVPTGLAHYLGLFVDSTPSSSFSAPFSALPFMMYMRIYRDYYMNQTLVNAAADDGQDLSWFPLDDEDFRLNIDNTQVSLDSNTTSGSNVPAFLSASGVDYRLGAWRWRNWSNDYFTTARPWPQRGDEALLDVGTVQMDSVPVGVEYNRSFQQLLGAFYPSNADASSLSPFYTTGGLGAAAQPVSNLSRIAGLFTGAGLLTTGSSSSATNLSLIANGETEVSLGVTLSALRELNSAQRIMEKMALVDGSYGDFCMTFFAVKDPNARNFKPYYIGGTYQKIQISEVINTADTYTSSGSGRAQGSQTGHASTYGQGNIGKFHSPSFGYIMGIMSIVPDTMYYQGINRQFSRLSQEQWFIPERAGLSPQSILNQEIYFVPGSDTQNEDLFGYQDRFDEMRYRPNEIHGKVADEDNYSFFPYTQARNFDALPTLSPEFVAMGTPVIGDPTSSSNVRSDWLTSSDEVPFVYQVANKVRAVRPLSYRAQPAELFDTRG